MKIENGFLTDYPWGTQNKNYVSKLEGDWTIFWPMPWNSYAIQPFHKVCPKRRISMCFHKTMVISRPFHGSPNGCEWRSSKVQSLSIAPGVRSAKCQGVFFHHQGETPKEVEGLHPIWYTLPETNMALEKGCLEDYTTEFPFGMALFSGAKLVFGSDLWSSVMYDGVVGFLKFLVQLCNMVSACVSLHSAPSSTPQGLRCFCSGQFVRGFLA